MKFKPNEIHLYVAFRVFMGENTEKNVVLKYVRWN